MRHNERLDSKFYINSSCAVFIVTNLFFILACIYVGVWKKFDYWYILPILVSFQTLITIIYVCFVKIKIDIYSQYYNNLLNWKIFFLLITLELIFLNVFAFIYGLYTFIKIFIKNKKTF